jgi:hypothetical protein
MVAVQYVSEPFTYQDLSPAAGVLARVYRGGTLVLATLFYDAVGTRAPNPARTDATGVLEFYVEPGAYDILINGTTFPILVSGDGGPGAPAWNFLTFSAGSPGSPGVGRSFVYNDLGRTLQIVSVRATAASVSGLPLLVDVNKNGVTIFTNQANRPQLPVSGAPGTVKATTIDVPAVLVGESLTIDIDQGNFTHLVVQVAVR